MTAADVTAASLERRYRERFAAADVPVRDYMVEKDLELLLTRPFDAAEAADMEENAAFYDDQWAVGTVHRFGLGDAETPDDARRVIQRIRDLVAESDPDAFAAVGSA